MTDQRLFAELRLVHRTGGRMRWKYRLTPGSPADPRVIAREVRELDWSLDARVNRDAASLVVRCAAPGMAAEAVRAALLELRVPASIRRLPADARSSPDWSGFATGLLALVLVPIVPWRAAALVSGLVALPVLSRAVRDVSHDGVTSHVLEGLAVGISIFRRDYFAAATTTFMLELGEYLEDSIARRSDDMLKGMLAPVGAEVWVERDGAERLVPADQVRVGDTVIVASGSVVPVDGTVLGGDATLNESSMTGESLPIPKTRGDTVLSGTHVEDGRLRVYAERVGARTAAARIADYVEQSLESKSAAQLEASRLADRLVPVVLGLAGGSFLLSFDARRAAAVLQADFSCALKLATPVAFKSAMYDAGKSGMLVKGAAALERLAEADTVVFDKTGTLTEGRLEVTDSLTFDASYSPDDLVCLAASVEEHYFHPVAMAVVEAAKNTCGNHFDHTEVEFIVAHGVASEVDGKRIVVGARHFIEDDEGIDVSAHQAEIDRLYAEGKATLYIGYGGALVGLLALKDRLRPNGAETVRRLRNLGVRRVLLLTGDHRDRAAEMAEELGLDGFHAELLPEDKARIVERLSAEGARIAFVGDGINDAPALAGSHVGIAMQRGADIARLSADIALLEDDIARVADAKDIANATMELVKTNYRLAVGFNSGILGLAALGVLSPVASSILHNGTTIGILLNALNGRRKP